MIETMLRSVDPRWTVQLEFPITQPSRGVIDLVLSDRSSPVVGFRGPIGAAPLGTTDPMGQ